MSLSGTRSMSAAEQKQRFNNSEQQDNKQRNIYDVTKRNQNNQTFHQYQSNKCSNIILQQKQTQSNQKQITHS